ncbi:ankyrin repeats (3 copies) domain-containing protein [Ditylenchus destructor]|uniref:Ankyrin repeats (3 copies) domain-containing protein n=1 Tax=Ditylenchus destructor TaxID=166010 RepID=A0AAD4MXS5_9BILA|nr:ankyrin repeats (3 copies) domain-containing protein [Ditylenchus destructor]
MGAYKSRPQLSCADELKKRISEGYAIVRSRLNDDIKPRFDSRSPLHITCFQGPLEEFREQLDHVNCAADADKTTSKDLSLLHLICIGICEQQSEKIRMLLEKLAENETRKRAILQQNTRNGFSALHIAVYKGERSAVETLLSLGADCNYFAPNVPPPLHLAAMSGNAEMVRTLVTHGAKLHTPDFVHFTPLHCAVYFGNEQAVRELVAAGADPNISGGVNDRALHIAAAKPHPTILSILLDDGGADPSLADDEGNTSLHFAAKTGHSGVIDYLLKKSKDPHEIVLKTNIYGDTPIHSACYTGRVEAVKHLLSVAGSSILTMENLFSETPLLAACTAGRSLELVAFLLRQPGIDPNFQAQDGHTALHSACYHGHLRVVQYLLDNGADQSLTARASDHPLNHGDTVSPPYSGASVASTMFAMARLDSMGSAGNSSKSSTHSLIEEQFQPQTPILWAYEKGHDQIVALLKHYANKRPDSDVCSEYSSGDSSYTPLPSPLGRLRSMTKEKAEILQLRAELKSALHLSLADIELKDIIGSGSFGKVYKGVYRAKTVAVKRYRALAFGCKTEVDLFCREVSIISRLKHQNVIQFVGACMDDPSQFAIVTEYVSAGSLFSLLHVQRRVFEMPLKLCIGADIARGMRYLHELTDRPVIHRDLNSHNVLLHNNGRAVVADFGESRFARERRPPLPYEPTSQFPVHIIQLLNLAWHADSAARPPFAQILPELEKHIPTEENRNFSIALCNGDGTTTDDEMLSDTELDLDDVGCVPTTVSKLKSQWEQLSVNDDAQMAKSAGSKAIEKLRQRIDNHGYVSQAARAISSAKSATQLRDKFVLARSANIAQRQNAFNCVNQRPTGNFTTLQKIIQMKTILHNPTPKRYQKMEAVNRQNKNRNESLAIHTTYFHSEH